MQVFKTFMKILKTRLTSAILYLVIFMVIAVIMADTAKDNNDYEDYKMSISVIDRDNSAESKRLQDFIFSGNKKVELADDEDEVIDAVYYGRSNYVLYINKDFGDKINAGDFDGLFENFKMPSSYGGQLFESRLDGYLSSVKAYMAAGESTENAMELTQTAVSQQVKAELKNFNNNGGTGMPAIFGYYFQYLAYVMLSMLIVTLCPVILTLNRKGVRERTMCSSLTSANYSRQTALGASILVFSIWLLFIIVAIIWGKTLNVKFWLACLNSFVYIIAAAGIAMIIAQFDLSDNGITAISNIIGLGMSFLCGVFVPQELLTGGVLAVGRLFPAYWYTKANNMLFGMSGGVFSTKEYLICIGIEALFAIAFFAVAALLVKQKREGDVNSLA